MGPLTLSPSHGTPLCWSTCPSSTRTSSSSSASWSQSWMLSRRGNPIFPSHQSYLRLMIGFTAWGTATTRYILRYMGHTGQGRQDTDHHQLQSTDNLFLEENFLPKIFINSYRILN